MRREFYSTNDRIDLSHTVVTTPPGQGLHPGHIHHIDEVLMQTPFYLRVTFAEVAICLMARVYNYYRSLGTARPDKDHSDLSRPGRLLFFQNLDPAIHIVRPYHRVPHLDKNWDAQETTIPPRSFHLEVGI